MPIFFMRRRFAIATDFNPGTAPSYHLPLALMLACTLNRLTPAEALMVGDDRVLDMTAADVGMRTFYVGRGTAPGTDFSGTLRDLIGLLPRLTRPPSTTASG